MQKGYEWIFDKSCIPKNIPNFDLPQNMAESLRNEVIRQIAARNALSTRLGIPIQIVWHIADLRAYDCVKGLF